MRQPQASLSVQSTKTRSSSRAVLIMNTSAESTRHEREDAVAKTFDGWVRDGKATGMERRHKRLAERMLERIVLPPDSRVLDIGCGDGWTARLVAGRLSAGAVFGLDVSREMVFQARRLSEELENTLFAPGAAEEIPWAEDYFTHVFSIESAYYWTEISLAAKEIFRVTAYGGSFHILINYYEENPFSAGWDRETGLLLHRLSTEEWARSFRDAGFEEVGTDQIPDDSPISPGKPPDEFARREGLQAVGALYVTGRKPALPESSGAPHAKGDDPFRILR